MTPRAINIACVTLIIVALLSPLYVMAWAQERTSIAVGHRVTANEAYWSGK